MAFTGLSIPLCIVTLDSTGEVVGDIYLITEWDGTLAAGALDTVRLADADTLHALSHNPCAKDVTVEIQVYDHGEPSQVFMSNPVEYRCSF
jgi:hypothetical protein